jgi:hypothetical protein
MKPYARYVFEKLPDKKTRYILQKHSGANIPDFPAFWKQEGHPYQGEGYITFRETQNNHPKRQYSHSLSLEKNRMFTGFNFWDDFPGMAFGDYGKDAVLIRFSEDWNILTVWFFESMKHQSASLYNQWISGGELVLD